MVQVGDRCVAGDAGETRDAARDAFDGPCPEGCAGARPLCDEARDMCVECLDATACDDDNECTLEACDATGACETDSGARNGMACRSGAGVCADGDCIAHRWSLRFGDVDSDGGVSIAVDGSGNVYATGAFQGRVDLGGGQRMSNGLSDIFVASYTAAGAYRWSKTFGGPGDDYGHSVVVDSVGDIYVTGRFSGTVEFEDESRTSVGADDIFIASYSPLGAQRWSRRFGGASSDSARSAAVDGSGNVYVTGYFSGTADFGGGSLPSAGSNDIFVASYTPAGAYRWSRAFGGTGDEQSYSVAVDRSGNVYVTGSFRGTANFGGGSFRSPGRFDDIFVAAYTLLGAPRWSQGFGSDGSDVGASVAVDASGNVYAVGAFSGTVDFGGGPLTSVGAWDIFVASYTASGGHRWSQRFGGTEADIASTVTLDSSGNVYATGYFQETADFGGGPLTSVGGEDLFIASYAPSGGHRWSRGFGDVSADVGYSIAVDSARAVYLTGIFMDRIDLGGGVLISTGDLDGFLMSLGP